MRVLTLKQTKDFLKYDEIQKIVPDGRVSLYLPSRLHTEILYLTGGKKRQRGSVIRELCWIAIRGGGGIANSNGLDQIRSRSKMNKKDKKKFNKQVSNQRAVMSELKEKLAKRKAALDPMIQLKKLDRKRKSK